MKDILFTLAKFYVEYRIDVSYSLRRFWIHIDREWFHPVDREDISTLIKESLK